MEKYKKLAAMVLTLVIAVISSTTVFADTTYNVYTISPYDNGPRMGDNLIDAAPGQHVYMDAINALELKPVENEAWGNDYYRRLYSVITDDMSNFQKLWAVYDDIVVNYTTSANCVGYAVALECAFKSLGLETYHMRGEVTTVGGGWTEHSWVGVNVSGKLLYFDANLPGRYGSPTSTYFGADPQIISSYNGAFVRVLELNPNGSGWLVVEDKAIPSDLA